MQNFLSGLFEFEQFIPHGHCYLWKPELVWLHAISDTLTAVAYYSIPLLLVYFASKRKDLPFRGVFLLFSAFIICCGTTHLIEVWTLWHPVYWLSGLSKAGTASISLFTALEMVALMPKALSIPSAQQLEDANRELEKQIAERKRIHEELQISEARFQAFMSHTPTVAFIKDEAGRYIYVNRRFEEIFNVNLSDIRGQTNYDFLDHKTARQLQENDCIVLETEMPIEVIEQVAPPDQDLIDWLVFKFPLSLSKNDENRYVGGIAFDITERQKLEAELRCSAARVRQAFDFEAMLKRVTDKVRDSLDESHILQTAVHELGIGLGVKYCTAALYDLDQKTSTVRYEYNLSMFPQQGQITYMEELPKVYKQLCEGECLQLCLIKPDPIRGYGSFLACSIKNNQEVIGDLWLTNDKDYMFQELELRLVKQVANQCAIAIRQARLYEAAQNQVRELEKLNQLKDDFLSTISHELRTPMSSIKMATQMLEISLMPTGLLDSEGSGETSKTARYFQILQQESQREISLINNLLDLSRLEAEVEPLLLTPIDPAVWIHHVTETFLERAREQQQCLKINIPDQLPLIVTDLSVLERILTELLNNACKYTLPHEEIQISAQEMPNHLQLQVRNSGVDVSAEELDHLFDKFYRIPNNDPWKHGGTGLGLALVQRFVKQIQGHIEVSCDRGWLTFTILLPWSLESQAVNPSSTIVRYF